MYNIKSLQYEKVYVYLFRQLKEFYVIIIKYYKIFYSNTFTIKGLVHIHKYK